MQKRSKGHMEPPRTKVIRRRIRYSHLRRHEPDFLSRARDPSGELPKTGGKLARHKYTPTQARRQAAVFQSPYIVPGREMDGFRFKTQRTAGGFTDLQVTVRVPVGPTYYVTHTADQSLHSSGIRWYDQAFAHLTAARRDPMMKPSWIRNLLVHSLTASLVYYP
ncbi:hypothetical protein B0T26DRAFT_680026 [Lasiosphaeria miniovina]|uniref:Uncharacterized protein n=1 Tax=Lasiosphaeria miniovina TaxID=1954250 RepID=A0AA40DKB1_9PEZI|nr:uncharacterized protein B0T26DRAFT_680026 [Lasiosphaeria miniovina]KAK0706325.1 hypothetical protein B0T26DRAFT_680026 [Lasiosphaeria miniovina]